MIKNKLFLLLICLTFLLNQSIVFAAKKYKILSCNPNIIRQGIRNLTLNIITAQPMPQNSLNEYLYSEIQFSNPSIHIEEVKFLNALSINCKISTDRYIDISKPVDMTIISYDQNGDEMIFEGKQILKFVRQSFIDDIVVHTNDGKITPGESANITVKGYNFQEGKIGVLVMWSGLQLFQTNCNNSRQFRFILSAEQTKNLKQGEYQIYIYNKDNTGTQSEKKIVVK
ncbi:MAG: hypothetical protein LBF97_04520 [Elusimicrobiota bacterium]|jgi:hypothetical protein|nr:hypothetical protein [Elusimicrobiota bacterium]